MWRRLLATATTLSVAILVLFLALHVGRIFENSSYIKYEQGDQATESSRQKDKPKEPFWDRATDDPTAVFTLALVVFTFVLAVSTVGLWSATNKLWGAGERQLRLARESAAAQSRDMQNSITVTREANEANRAFFITAQRPWIYVEAAPLGITYNINGLNLHVKFSITNSGNSPAVHVNLYPQVIAPNMSNPKATDSPRHVIASNIKARRFAPLAPWGATIPARPEPLIQTMSIFSISKADLDSMTSEFEAAYLTLIVIVEYRFVFDETLHFTACAFDVIHIAPPHKDGWAPNLIIPSAGDIPGERLLLRQSFFSGEYAD